MKIEKVITTVNGNRRITWRWQGGKEEYNSIRDLLASKFCNQGEFYATVLSVSFSDAELAGWEPNFWAFDHKYSKGWAKFLGDKGKINKQTEIERLDILDVIFEK